MNRLRNYSLNGFWGKDWMLRVGCWILGIGSWEVGIFEVIVGGLLEKR
jgi:hypothetical protein